MTIEFWYYLFILMVCFIALYVCIDKLIRIKKRHDANEKEDREKEEKLNNEKTD